MKVRSLFFVIISFLVFQCSESPSLSVDDEAFGIYLLKDTLMITSEAKKEFLESIELQDKPLININDIVTYDWDEQNIYLTAEALLKFQTIEKKIKSVYGLPFVVTAEGQKIYLGNIYPMYSSYIHEDLPFISVAPFVELRIDKAVLEDIEDVRKDNRIYTVMKLCGKLK